MLRALNYSSSGHGAEISGKPHNNFSPSSGIRISRKALSDFLRTDTFSSPHLRRGVSQPVPWTIWAGSSSQSARIKMSNDSTGYLLVRSILRSLYTLPWQSLICAISQENIHSFVDSICGVTWGEKEHKADKFNAAKCRKDALLCGEN